jgi:hypothetical protein
MNYIKNHIMPRSKLFDFVREIKKKKKKAITSTVQ